MSDAPATPHSPLAPGAAVRRLRTHDAGRLIQDWHAAFSIDIAAELRGHGEIELWQCEASGLRFFSPSDLAGSPQLYEQLGRFDWYYMADKWEHREALRHLRRGARVLEVGCGRGAFIETCRAAGLDARGIELNPQAVAAAQERCLPVELADLSHAAEKWDGQLDAVCAFQVLEHLAQPRPFLERAVRLLRPGGRLIVSVPNPDGYLKHQHCLLDMPPHHMTQWPAAAFRFLETILPVRLLAVRAERLAAYHVEDWVQTQRDRLAAHPALRRLLLNRLTTPALAALLALGARRLVTGHTQLAAFAKVP